MGWVSATILLAAGILEAFIHLHSLAQAAVFAITCGNPSIQVREQYGMARHQTTGGEINGGFL